MMYFSKRNKAKRNSKSVHVVGLFQSNLTEQEVMQLKKDRLDGFFSCPKCQGILKGAVNYAEHLRIVHPEYVYSLSEEKKLFFCCPKCPGKIVDKEAFYSHLHIHSSLIFWCPDCNKGSTNNKNFRTHLKRVHSFNATSKIVEDMYAQKMSRNETSKKKNVYSFTSADADVSRQPMQYGSFLPPHTDITGSFSINVGNDCYSCNNVKLIHSQKQYLNIVTNGEKILKTVCNKPEEENMKNLQQKSLDETNKISAVNHYLLRVRDWHIETPEARHLNLTGLPNEVLKISSNKASTEYDLTSLACPHGKCEIKWKNRRGLFRHIKVVHHDFIYVCDIKSFDSIGCVTQCVNRTLKAKNFREHLKEKHKIKVSHIRDVFRWKQLKKGGPNFKDFKECAQCYDCKKARNHRK